MTNAENPRRPPHSPPTSGLSHGRAPHAAVGPTGRRIRQLMEAAGLNQLELAQRSGVPQGRLSAIIRGQTKRVPTPKLEKLAEALKVRVVDLLDPEEVSERVEALRHELSILEAEAA